MSNYMSREFKEQMTRKYFSMVYKLALNQTKSKESSDDVVQEVFLRYIQKDIDFKSEEHIKAWLIRVTINCSKNVFADSWFKKTEGFTQDIPFEHEEKSDVYYATLELPQKYRSVIHLFYYEGMSISEISLCLGQKENTVKSLLHRARAMLRDKLEGGYDFV